jgi:transcriptional regulator with XRE-family HTH domain
MLMSMSSRQTLSQTAAGALRAEMARQRKTSAELAQHIGKSTGYVSARMNCRHDFTLAEIEQAAEWLGVPYIDLLTSPKRESEAA